MNHEQFSYLDINVQYPERILMPSGTLVTVSLSDVSLQDTAAPTVASQSLRTGASYGGFSFKLCYDPNLVDDNHVYSISARIEQAGHLSHINPEAFIVDLKNPPSTPLEVTVLKIRNS